MIGVAPMLLLAGCGGGGSKPKGTAPGLISVAPVSGSSLGGTPATLVGTGLQAGGATVPAVTYGGLAATNVVVIDDMTVTCTIPAATPGTRVDVVVTNNFGTGMLVGAYTYHLLPTVSGSSPASGTSIGGIGATITGSGFSDDSPGVNTVTFGGVAASNVVVVDDSTITCDTPAGSSGATVDIVVSNDNGSATLSSAFTNHLVPTLASSSVVSGPTAGGTGLTLTGTGFQNQGAGPNAVTFGGVAATNIVVVDDTSLTCDVPAGVPGMTVDVEVTNTNGVATMVGGFFYHPLPTLVSITPVSGSFTGGSGVELTGTGFQDNTPGVNAVTFGGVAATNVVVVSDTTLTCDTPAGAAASVVDIAVSNLNGAAMVAMAYTYTTEPLVASVTPASGVPGGATSVTISGLGFVNPAAGPNTVTFGGSPATSVVTLNDTTITCDTPAGAPATMVDVAVSNSNGIGVRVNGFRYFGPPALTLVGPGVGRSFGGTPVTLTGTGFQDDNPGTNVVTFDGALAASVMVVNDTTITCLTPVGAAGWTIDVVVTNDNGVATLMNGYRYAALPTLASVTPPNGSTAGGSSVTLTGTGFQNDGAGTNTVTFGGAAATNVAVVNDTTLTCDTPTGAASVDVIVSNTNGSATLSSGFTFFAPPTVTSVGPTSGSSLGGEAVTVTGSGFQNNGPGINVVTFDETTATNVVVVNDTTITCDTPTGTPGSSVDVVVSNDNGTDTLTDGYAYHDEPSLTGVAPSSGSTAGGTGVTLTGSGFLDNAAGTNSVSFGGNPATNVVVASDTTITCDTPAGAGGSVDVVVSNDNGSGSALGAFSYSGSISASISTVTVSPAFGSLADDADTATITVTVLDSLGNPLAGETVQLSATGVGNTIVQPGPTNGSGVTTGTIRTTHAETKTITATVDPSGSPVVLDDNPTSKFIWDVASTYFVRKTGSDANSGASPAAAWLTIGNAAATLVAGDRVYVGAGTYAESITVTSSGSVGAPIRFLADSSGGATGDAGEVIVDAMGGAFGFRVSGAEYVTLEGFVITGAAGGGAAGVLIETAGSDSVVVRDNVIYGNDYGLSLSSGLSATIENNVISNNLTGVRLFSGADASVTNNLICNNTNEGIMGDGVGTTGSITANTVYLNGGVGIDVLSSASFTVDHNIVANGAADGIRVTGATLVSTYNNSFGNAGTNFAGAITNGTGDISADPAFEDPDGADGMLGGAQGADDRFQLDATVPSPSIDAGGPVAHTFVLWDGTNFADMTTRLDQVLDGSDPDGDTVNMGYHYAFTPSPPAALVEDDGRINYARKETEAIRQPQARTWNGATESWSASGAGLPVGLSDSTPVGMVTKLSPLDNDEELIGVLASDATDASTELDFHRWDGVEWQLEFSISVIDPGVAERLMFDIEYEQSTGDALVVYSNNTATPVYRARSQGVWSAEVSLPLNDGAGPNPDTNTGTVRWVEMEPRPADDEVTLLFADDNNDLVAIVWDGTQWLTASAITHETDLWTPSTNLVDNRCFDLAYEEATGDVLVAWGHISFRGFYWSAKLAGTTTWSAKMPVAAGFPDQVGFVDLSTEPGGTRIGVTYSDIDSGPKEELEVAIWDGSAWSFFAYASAIRNSNGGELGDFPSAFGWLGTGSAVVLYADSNTGAIDWASWTPTGWVAQFDVPIAGKGFTESIRLETFDNEVKILAVFSDSNSDLYAATYDGTSWTVTNGGPALETDLTSVSSMPFSIGIKR